MQQHLEKLVAPNGTPLLEFGTYRNGKALAGYNVAHAVDDISWEINHPDE